MQRRRPSAAVRSKVCLTPGNTARLSLGLTHMDPPPMTTRPSSKQGPAGTSKDQQGPPSLEERGADPKGQRRRRAPGAVREHATRAAPCGSEQSDSEETELWRGRSRDSEETELWRGRSHDSEETELWRGRSHDSEETELWRGRSHDSEETELWRGRSKLSPEAPCCK
uniref:Uncharacterized protein n=1 Tax=Knipowitschia caucasica TaxID=637954 RepID=A0AAV2L974_KNICA